MKHAVIIGSSKGIGLGIAKELLKYNFSLTITGTTELSLLKAKEELSENFSTEKILFSVCKIQNPADIERIWDQSNKKFKKIHLWINNAGIAQENKIFSELENTQIAELIDINIKGQMIATKIVYKKMQNQGFGAIYNMLGYGYNNKKKQKLTLYGTSKCAGNYFLDSFVKETKDSKIIVGGLMPGMVITDLLMTPIAKGTPERIYFEKILNILADRVETVAPFLVKNMLKNKKHGKKIIWLTARKASWRFLSYPITKRKIL